MAITWLDKIDGLDLANPRKNVNADDMNQIKSTANAAESGLSSHVGNSSNPHSVTKAQVGLSNVDNTADSGKPVSTAQQTAIDAKVANDLTASTTVAPSKTAVNTGLALRLLIANIVFNEVPTGTINGSNDTFTIANNVLSGLVMFFADGLCVNPDGFELTGTTVVFSIPPDNSLTVTYIKA